MTATYDFPEPGCYQDGACHNQTEMDLYVIELAAGYGWVDPCGMHNTVDVSDEDEEYLSEVADEAIDFLNSLETRDGHWWGYDNGDFGLWTEEEQ